MLHIVEHLLNTVSVSSTRHMCIDLSSPWSSRFISRKELFPNVIHTFFEVILSIIFRETYPQILLFNFDSKLSSIQKLWQWTRAKSHMNSLSLNTVNLKSKAISKTVHDQGWEEVCWCYALTTMLRSSMRAAVRNNPSKSNANILTKEEHHKLMRKEIVLNVYPFGNDGTDPSIVVKLLTTPSCLLDPGILRLSSVTSVLKNIEFESQIFVNP